MRFPDGEAKRGASIRGEERAQDLLSFEFEKYSFIPGYWAVCSPEDGFIEAALNDLAHTGSLIGYRLFGVPAGTAAKADSFIEMERGEDTALKAQLRLSPRKLGAFVRLASPPAWLTIEGASFSNQDQAANLLERIADSLFFEIDVRFNIGLGLFKLMRGTQRSPNVRSDDFSRKPLQLPEYSYDRQPVSLYWYGRAAVDMPLLQFLAFYQAIEFYFPVYSRNEAIKQVRTMLKNPGFSVQDDNDIGRLLSAVQTGRSGAFGKELDQLRATVLHCVSAGDLREYFASDEGFSKFYLTEPDWKAVSSKRIPLGNTEADLRNDVADRIYDIRCKIVHARGDGGPANTELLLPFSKEADLLGFDIELARYVARQVLIASSSRLEI